MMFRFKRLLYFIPAILYMAFIFWLSSYPAPEEAHLFPIIARLKLVHLIEYGLLCLLISDAVIKTTKLSKNEIFALAVMIAILYGATDEFHQIFVPARTASVVDIIADGIGAILAHLLAYRYLLSKSSQ